MSLGLQSSPTSSQRDQEFEEKEAQLSTHELEALHVSPEVVLKYDEGARAWCTGVYSDYVYPRVLNEAS